MPGLTSCRDAESRMRNKLFTRPQLTIADRLIAHRGAHNAAPGNTDKKLPENSIPALLAAFSEGLKRVELDIIRLKSGEFIVFHDETLERLGRFNPEIASTLTAKKFNAICKKPLTELTYDDVSQVDIGSYDNFDIEYRGMTVPLLDDFLKNIRGGRGQLIVELKSDDVRTATALQVTINKAMQQYLLREEQLIFISFDYALIAASKALLPNHKHFLLTTASPEGDQEAKSDTDNPLSYTGLYHRIQSEADLDRCIFMVKTANLDGLDIEYSPKIDKKFVEKIHAAGLMVIVWNYPEHDNASCAKQLLEVGVDFINTNQPRQLLHALKLNSPFSLEL